MGRRLWMYHHQAAVLNVICCTLAGNLGMAVIRYEFSVNPGRVQELGLGAEELPKTERKMGTCCSQHAAHSTEDGDASGSTCARDSLCALQLALGTAGTV